MEKIIKVDILNFEDFLNKYNQNEVSPELINYLIEQVIQEKNQDIIKIVINNKYKLEKDCKEMIVEGLKKEYNKSMKLHHHYDSQQRIFFLIGTILLLLSTTITKSAVAKEILVIIAGVPIWKMAEMELLEDHEGRIRRKMIKRILRSKIEFVNQ